MSLFESSITGNVLNDGSTTEISGITAGQLATVLTAYTPLTDTAANTAAVGANAAGLAALQAQVAALPPPPNLAPYALAADLASAEGSIAANQSSITALNTSLVTSLAGKANQSALDALQLEVDAKSTPASVDAKLAGYSNTAAMNSAIASANNATLATVGSAYALRTVTDQLALDLAAKQSGPDVDSKIATALLDRPSSTDLTTAVNLKTTPADVDQKVATALLTCVTQVALDAALALRDGRHDSAEASIASLQAAGFQTAAQVASAIATALLPYTDTTGLNSLLAVRDGRLDSAETSVAALQAAGYQTSAQVASALAAALLPYVQQTGLDAALALRDLRLDAAETSITLLQGAGPFASSGDLNALETSLQSAIDAVLAQLAALTAGGGLNLANAQAWPGFLGPAGGHQHDPEPALCCAFECESREREFHPEPRLRLIQHCTNRCGHRYGSGALRDGRAARRCHRCRPGRVQHRRLGFLAQDFEGTGITGTTYMGGKEELLTLDYSRLTAVLWGVCKQLQRRIEALEKPKKAQRRGE